MHKQREAGVAVLVMVLFTAIILIVVVSITSAMTLGSRRGAASETRAYQAALASESGQNAFTVRSRSVAQYGGGIPATCTGSTKVKALCGVNAWLTTVTGTQAPGSFTVESAGVATGGTVSLVAVDVDLDPTTNKLTSVDIEARGTTTAGQARVLQRYTAVKADLGFPNVPGAVTSYPSVQIQGGPTSTIAGTTATSADNTGLYDDLLTVSRAGSASALGTGSVTLNVNTTSQARASQVAVGSYIQLPLSDLAGTLSSTQTGTFKVTGNTGTTLAVTPVRMPTITGGAALPSGDLGLDYVMNGIVSYNSNVLTMNSKESFVVGDQVAVKVGVYTYTSAVSSTVTNPDGTQSVTVGTWTATTPTTVPATPSAPAFTSYTALDLEGRPVQKSTNAVVTAGSFTTGGQATATGDVKQGTAGAALVPSPLSDALFIKTFGMTPSQMKPLASVFTEAQFDGDVSGLTWVTGTAGDRDINMNNEKVQGTGILIVDGDLTINQTTAEVNSCGFKGIIYVRGNVDIRGNLQLCGAIVVEGSILSSDGLTVTGVDDDDSDFGGNGRKVSYDPEAIFDAVAAAGAYTFTRVPAGWRQR
ncbi:hypothetical protein [Deinococcus malanensis]|nr:hypothetical protein [Deinococcus malanensis]